MLVGLVFVVSVTVDAISSVQVNREFVETTAFVSAGKTVSVSTGRSVLVGDIVTQAVVVLNFRATLVNDGARKVLRSIGYALRCHSQGKFCGPGGDRD